ncbi:MAG TPA: hypothetical protein VM939_07630 [Gemmatimonadaceae bacterium]|nr:hypothetical protein [Gemmatimonadaceae bacterium]
MLRHHVFFETLGSLREDDPAWRSTLAGLAVLRLIDHVADARSSGQQHDWPMIHAARQAVGALPEGDAARAILFRAIDLIDEGPGLSARVGDEMIAFGRALDIEGRWKLSVDVYQSVVSRFPAPAQTKLTIEACIAFGSAARKLGDWDASARSYAQAQHIADVTGDRAASLTVQIGVAGTLMARGNLPAADRDIDEVIAEARASGFSQVEAIALHAKGSVAHSRGDYQRALHYAYRSLELTTNKSARERILADIAAACAGLGLRDAARDGYTIVALTSPHQWVRWQATVNLMELAITDDDEAAFDEYLRQTEDAALDPRLRSYFLLYKAIGYDRFDREGAQEMFVAASTFAGSHGFHQVEFEADAALEASRNKAPRRFAAEPQMQQSVVDDEVRRIAEALIHLREQATL